VVTIVFWGCFVGVCINKFNKKVFEQEVFIWSRLWWDFSNEGQIISKQENVQDGKIE
jgi:hypothetical protein